jgi:hypothetical protein
MYRFYNTKYENDCESWIGEDVEGNDCGPSQKSLIQLRKTTNLVRKDDLHIGNLVTPEHEVAEMGIQTRFSVVNKYTF